MVRKVVLAAGILSFGVLLGCIRRVEIVAVAPDGSCDLLALLEGEAHDMRAGDALPARELGWEVREELKKDNDGKETFVLAARQHLAAGVPQPASYAKPGSLLADAALGFPTSLRVEKREDGTYYHFARTYRARSWAWIGTYQKELLESDEINAITQKDPGAISTEERAKVAKALIDFESHKQLGILDQALDAVAQRVPQDAALKARAAASGIYRAQPLLERVAAKVLVKDSELDAAALESELQGRVRETLEKSLGEHKLPKETIDAALAAYDAALLRYRVTEDLGDEAWGVGVILPGRIIAHDSTQEPVKVDTQMDRDDDSPPELQQLLDRVAKSDFAPGFEMLRWEFEGKALYDREVTMRATSFVPK